MKIRKLTPDNHTKVTALLRQVFPGSYYEEQLAASLRKNEKMMYEWACIHRNMVVAYIAFSNAYNGADVCGLHLAPIAVKPEFQHQGIGSELLRFALRQKIIKESTLYVLGNPGFYGNFGFESCVNPICPFAKKNKNFLSIRNDESARFTVGYEPEFTNGGKL